MTNYFQAMIKLSKGIFKIHPFWVVYIQLLVFLHGILPFFFFPELEAYVVIFCFYTGALTMAWLTMRFGFSRILGAAHVWWVPMFIFLLTRIGRIDTSTAFGVWLLILLVIQPITLALDIWDVTRWLRGDRTEMVAGL